ncbi:MAG: flagellar basal body P-ring protein FlgI [Planctomycetes bacterium]|nr:flagellar basal body P-ring protein FlgI [Planctomycetota bacterium]
MHRFLLTFAVLLLPSLAHARVRLENICTVYGQKEVKVAGVGLVVGLEGTGDGGRNLPAMRALASVLSRRHNPADVDELRDAKNVALVWIEATIPKTGLRRGQRIDCHVSSTMGAKSLRGGRLLVAPLTEAAVESDRVVGLASGPVRVEDADSALTGRIVGGVVLEDNFPSLFVDRERGHLVTLLLDPAHASFHSASEVAREVNLEFVHETTYDIARAAGPGLIEVVVPQQYHNDPVSFMAALMAVGVENPHTQARVVVNAASGTVIVTGEVEISPVIISHKNLTVQVGGPGAATGGPQPFVSIDGDRSAPSGGRLQQLVEGLNELRVPTSDVIDILRELHRTGKLHAVYEEQ